MQKVLAILLMLLVCTVYILSIRDDTKVGEKKNSHETANIQKELQALEEKLQYEETLTPKEVILLHNQLMEYAYSEAMKEEDVKSLIDTMRRLYSKELLALNDYEGQIELFKQEVLNNQDKKMFIKESEIESIEFTESNTALVKVVHGTTKEQVERMYTLIKEDSGWKIYSWENR